MTKSLELTKMGFANNFPRKILLLKSCAFIMLVLIIALLAAGCASKADRLLFHFV